MRRDEHGQPPPGYYADRVSARLIAEMMGICRGILYDRRVTDEEIVGLANFIATHEELTSEFPGRDIARRLTRILADRVIDETERSDLRELLEALVAPAEHPTDFDEHATRALFTEPPPSLFFDGHKWVITGRFAFGNRALVEKRDHRSRRYNRVCRLGIG